MRSSTPALISEAELRAATRVYLAERAQVESGRVFEEFTVELGAARADFAFIGERLEAFELKSDYDDFSRLHNQIHAYNRSFEQITIITGPVFSEAVLRVVPSWWGVLTATRRQDRLHLHSLRTASGHTTQSATSVSMLLWREEAIDILATEGGQRAPRRATRHQLRERLIASLSVDELRFAVAKRLRTRHFVAKPECSRILGDGWLHHDASCSDFHCLT